MNTGHGHVRPRPDGFKARCGGPALCDECLREAENLNASPLVELSRFLQRAMLPPGTTVATAHGGRALILAHTDFPAMELRVIEVYPEHAEAPSEPERRATVHPLLKPARCPRCGSHWHPDCTDPTAA